MSAPESVEEWAERERARTLVSCGALNLFLFGGFAALDLALGTGDFVAVCAGFAVLGAVFLAVGLLHGTGPGQDPAGAASAFAAPDEGAAARRRAERERQAMVEIDARGVRRQIGGKVEEIRWDQLVRVLIVTTDEGPFVDDVYWLLVGEGEAGCAVPGEAAAPLLKRLQRLPGFDDEAVIRASGSTEEATFLVWEGRAGEAWVAGSGLVDGD